MTKSIKKTANRFIKQNHIAIVNYSVLKEVVKKIGFTVIEFNSILNDNDVGTIIKNLNLDEAVMRSRGFTYADRNYRLVFINEDLNDEEKLYILSHELGHIVCGHYTSSPIIGRDVKEEHEANEFSHYLLKQSFLCRVNFAVKKHNKASAAIILVLSSVIALTIAGFVKKEKVYYGNFYITPMGSKYHQTECIHIKRADNAKRLTRKQFETGEYKPCGICLPEE